MTKERFIREVRASEAMLYHVSMSILKNETDCADAVQETLLRAYEKLHTLKKEEFFRTWITRILIHECYGMLRKRKKSVPYEEYMENTRAGEDRQYSQLYCAVLELPEELRMPVTLYYLEGFSVRETGNILGIREGTVKSRLSRARKLLKERLEEEGIVC